jgi:hypothetical protein
VARGGAPHSSGSRAHKDGGSVVLEVVAYQAQLQQRTEVGGALKLGPMGEKQRAWCSGPLLGPTLLGDEAPLGGGAAPVRGVRGRVASRGTERMAG